jgi:glycosyltransferase involved in cell wall biosynthesis
MRLRSIRMIYPFVDGIICVSHGVADDLVQTAGVRPNSLNVVYNPIVTTELIHQADSPVGHPWLQAGQPPVILGAGRLTRQKDFATLIHAVSRVIRERHCRLLIIGEGHDRLMLQQLIRQLHLEKAVDLPGFVDNPFAYMKRSQVFVLSSAWEGFGNVLVEAMAVGTPVVATDCPSGPREILDNGRFGPLVPPGQPHRLAEAIVAMLNSPTDAGLLQTRAADFSARQSGRAYRRVLFDAPAVRKQK